MGGEELRRSALAGAEAAADRLEEECACRAGGQNANLANSRS